MRQMTSSSGWTLRSSQTYCLKLPQSFRPRAGTPVASQRWNKKTWKCGNRNCKSADWAKPPSNYGMQILICTPLFTSRTLLNSFMLTADTQLQEGLWVLVYEDHKHEGVFRTLANNIKKHQETSLTRHKTLCLRKRKVKPRAAKRRNNEVKSMWRPSLYQAAKF